MQRFLKKIYVPFYSSDFESNISKLKTENTAELYDYFIGICNAISAEKQDGEPVYLTYFYDKNAEFYAIKNEKNKINFISDIAKASKNYDFEFFMPLELECLEISFKENLIKVKEFNSTSIQYTPTFAGSNGFMFPFHRFGNSRILTFFSTESILFEKNGKRHFPITLKTFNYLKSSYYKIIFGILLEKWQKINLFWRDLAKNSDILMSQIYPPIEMKKVFEYGNSRNLIETQLKIKLPKSANKLDFSSAYYIAKAAKIIPENERQKLFALGNSVQNELELCKFTSEKSRVKAIYTAFYNSKSNEIETGNCTLGYKNQTIKDYVEMLFQTKQIPPMSVQNLNGIIRRHDELAREITLNSTVKITVPPDSKFNKLALPLEFERITTRKRLIEEGLKNKNCVASYAPLINRDTCAIFSTVHNEMRYTIEIRKQRKKFVVAQVCGYANSECPPELEKTICELVNQSN